MENPTNSKPRSELQTPSSDIGAETVSSANFNVASKSQSGDKTQTLKMGERIGGCVITRFVAWGGMGEVYEGKHETLDRRVAIKLIRSQYADDPKYRARFLREAKAAAQFTDPHIALVFDAGDDNGRLYVTHEYIEGEDLAQRLARLQMLSPSDALRTGRDVAKALVLAHAKGVIHRDVKPSNIMIAARDGRAKLMDFGLVRVTHGGEFEHAERETVVGTPRYMGPEQWQSSTVDGRADLYSLGVSLYEALSGALPVSGKTLNEIYEQTINGRLTPLRERHPGLSPDIYALVEGLLAPLDRRIQSASEVVARIESILKRSESGRALSSASIETPVLHKQTVAPAAPLKSVSWTLRVALLGALLFLGAALFFFTRKRAEPNQTRVRLDWLLAGQHKSGAETWEPRNLLENPDLNSGDQFQIRVLPHQDCFVYVVMVTSQGEPILLHPASGDPAAGAVKEEESVVLPSSELWYKLDDHPGLEKIYVVASHEPIQSLSRVLTEAATRGATGEPSGQSWQQTLHELDKMSETKSSDRGIAGVTTAKPVFIKLADGSSAPVNLSSISADSTLVKKVSLQHH